MPFAEMGTTLGRAGATGNRVWFGRAQFDVSEPRCQEGI